MNTLVGQEAKANRTLCGLRRVSVRTMAAARMEVTSAARAAGVISDGDGSSRVVMAVPGIATACHRGWERPKGMAT